MNPKIPLLFVFAAFEVYQARCTKGPPGNKPHLKRKNMETLLLDKHALSDHQGSDIHDCQESDSSLIDRAFLGDQAAFEHLVSRYSPALLTFVRRRTSEEQVEDIVQSVFFRL